MKDAINELLNTVYHYYPRGISKDDPRYEETREHLRLVAARRTAGADRDTWQAMLQRLEDKFPEGNIQDESIHLASGHYDASYSGKLYLPKAPGEHDHMLVFLVSFVVRYYSVFSLRIVEDIEKTAAARASQARNVCVFVDDTCYVLPAGVVDPEMVAEQEPITVFRNDIRFDFAPAEQPYAACIAQDIEATWGYERLPPEVGKIIVPDVATNLRSLGEATLHDCLLSDNW